MKRVTLYHSVICPRCQISKLVLKRVLKDYPAVSLQRIEFLSHLRQAKRVGVKSIPALVAGDKKLTGVIFTAAQLRKFFDSL